MRLVCHINVIFATELEKPFLDARWVLMTDMFPSSLWPPVPDAALVRSAAPFPGRHQAGLCAERLAVGGPTAAPPTCPEGRS